MGRTVGSRQLVLALGHAESFAREDFVAAPSNAAALALIDRWPDWPDSILALSGPGGSGKSHLASIWGEKAGARFLSGRSLEGAHLPTAFSTGALVIEDLAPALFDEVSLFHLINLAREQKAYVLITGRTPPASWPVGLRDLQSRLRALPAVRVSAPDDALLRALIAKLAADRQLDFDDSLLSYVTQRVERSFAGARVAIERLDREAMRRHRPITKALAAELFRDGTA